VFNLRNSLTHSWSWALLEKLPIVQLLMNFQHFMEPEGSVPCSQEPSTGPYREPDQSNQPPKLQNLFRLHLVQETFRWICSALYDVALYLIKLIYKLYNSTNLNSRCSLFCYRLDNWRMGFDFQQGKDTVTYTVRSEGHCAFRLRKAAARWLRGCLSVSKLPLKCAAVVLWRFIVFSCWTAVEV
jgi:hypothetical protein